MISVVIPYYNRPKDLCRLLEKHLICEELITQVVIVNDGSNLPIPNEIHHASEKIEIIYQQNAGPGAARIMGFEFVTGEFVHFMDCDDDLSTGFYKEIYDHVTPEIDCVCTNVKEVMSVASKSQSSKAWLHELTSYDGCDYSERLLDATVPTFYQNKLFRVAKLSKELMSNARINEDVSSIWRQFLNFKKVHIADRATLFYVKGSNSIMSTYNQNKISERIKVFTWIDRSVCSRESNVWKRYRSIYFSNVVLLGSLKMLKLRFDIVGALRLHLLLARVAREEAIILPPLQFRMKRFLMLPSWLFIKMLWIFIK